MFEFLNDLYTNKKTRPKTIDLTSVDSLNVIRINPDNYAIDIMVISDYLPSVGDYILIRSRKNTITRYKLDYVEKLNSSNCGENKIPWKAQARFAPRKK